MHFYFFLHSQKPHHPNRCSTIPATMSPASPELPRFSTRSIIFPTALPRKIKLLGPTSIDATIDSVIRAMPISVTPAIDDFILSILFPLQLSI